MFGGCRRLPRAPGRLVLLLLLGGWLRKYWYACRRAPGSWGPAVCCFEFCGILVQCRTWLVLSPTPCTTLLLCVTRVRYSYHDSQHVRYVFSGHSLKILFEYYLASFFVLFLFR
jgi:hypothetical protein